jgi:Ras-related C3 botulinum toxin substrate 1
VKQHAPTTPILLIGTKADLRDESSSATPSSVVAQHEGSHLAKKLGAYTYIECSAKRKDHINEIFEKALHAVVLPVKKKRKKRICRLM